MPPWVVPGQSRIFLVHRGGEKEASRGRIFGYFVVNRTEVLAPADELVPTANGDGGSEGRPAPPTVEQAVRTRRCWNGETIVTHRYDAQRKRWIRTAEECPDPPEPPEEQESTGPGSRPGPRTAT